MKEYPSISGMSEISDVVGKFCISFVKIDGSNLRVEYNKKQGWYKWGTRRRMFDVSDPEYGTAIAIFERDYAELLAKAINDCKEFRGGEGAVAFLEFFGPNSFAGWHDPIRLGCESNEPMELRLFDVNINKKGLVGPRQFLKTFGHLKIPEVIYDGVLDADFVQDVREGKYPVHEGVICKGGDGFKHTLWMRKIKTWAYLEELKRRAGDEWIKLWE